MTIQLLNSIPLPYNTIKIKLVFLTCIKPLASKRASTLTRYNTNTHKIQIINLNVS